LRRRSRPSLPRCAIENLRFGLLLGCWLCWGPTFQLNFATRRRRALGPAGPLRPQRSPAQPQPLCSPLRPLMGCLWARGGGGAPPSPSSSSSALAFRRRRRTRPSVVVPRGCAPLRALREPPPPPNPQRAQRPRALALFCRRLRPRGRAAMANRTLSGCAEFGRALSLAKCPLSPLAVPSAARSTEGKRRRALSRPPRALFVPLCAHSLWDSLRRSLFVGCEALCSAKRSFWRRASAKKRRSVGAAVGDDLDRASECTQRGYGGADGLQTADSRVFGGPRRPLWGLHTAPSVLLQRRVDFLIAYERTLSCVVSGRVLCSLFL
jgi:hypothetical protein